MDSKAIFLIDDYLTKRGIVDFENDTNAVMEREKGKVFCFSDHIRALIYSLLTNQREWSTVEPKLKDIDKLFFDYDETQILSKDGKYFEDGIRKLRCGNISIKKQMENLNRNILTFMQIEEDYGSMDAFVTSAEPEDIVEKLSTYNSEYKILGLGEALAWEYLRNVGIDASKPDTHLKRFFGATRMGDSRFDDATDDEVINEVKRISKETGYSKFEVDYLIWCYCASGKGEICTANPKCNKCVIRKYCKKHCSIVK